MVISKDSSRGFTTLEFFSFFSVGILVVAVILSALIHAHLSARNSARIQTLNIVAGALRSFQKDHGYFPREADGANGNISTNPKFIAMLKPYLSAPVVDPVGADDPTFYYYYDGSAQCGAEKDVILFARQMDHASNSNYSEFLNSCGGILDGEGRGRGTESYNILLGKV